MLLALAPGTKQLSHVRLSINTRRRRPEHLLKPHIRLLCLLAGQNHTGLDVDLFLHDHLGQRYQLDQEGQLALFVFEALGVELFALEKAGSKVSLLERSCVDIMQVPEGWLAEQLLGHLGLLE